MGACAYRLCFHLAFTWRLRKFLERLPVRPTLGSLDTAACHSEAHTFTILTRDACSSQ